jgi:hypothetical protein
MTLHQTFFEYAGGITESDDFPAASDAIQLKHRGKKDALFFTPPPILEDSLHSQCPYRIDRSGAKGGDDRGDQGATSQ